MCCCCCLFLNDIIVPNIKWVIWYYVAYTVYNAKNRRTETAYNIWWLLVVSLSMINCAGGCREAINASNNRTERRRLSYYPWWYKWWSVKELLLSSYMYSLWFELQIVHYVDRISVWRLLLLYNNIQTILFFLFISI